MVAGCPGDTVYLDDLNAVVELAILAKRVPPPDRWVDPEVDESFAAANPMWEC